ncbi:MAG TPA: hypothetical protein DCQ30_01975 [Acidimicrobiaceae bacterium]|nr:hypothetical protein [Acidimicrobiaceae bacterium]
MLSLGRRVRWARSVKPESGITLIEVMIATLVMSVIVAGVVGVVADMQQVGNRAISGENASDTARNGLLQLERDLEAANPLLPWTTTCCGSPQPSVTAYGNEIQLDLGPTGGTQQTITWSCQSGTLWRDIGTSAGTGVPEVTGVTNCAPSASSPSSNPVFTFYGAQEENLLANPASVTPAIITACSVRIQGVVQVTAGANTTPFTENVSVRLANWIRGAQPCP